MEFTITVRSTDLTVPNDIGSMQIEGVTVKRSMKIREIYPAPIDFIIYIGEHVALPIAAGLIARYIYDKLKDKKNEVKELSINNQTVEINAEKIEQLILVNLQKEKDDSSPE